jgi:hypothetical protein
VGGGQVAVGDPPGGNRAGVEVVGVVGDAGLAVPLSTRILSLVRMYRRLPNGPPCLRPPH